MDAHYMQVIVAKLCLPWGSRREDTIRDNTVGLGHVWIGQGDRYYVTWDKRHKLGDEDKLRAKKISILRIKMVGTRHGLMTCY